MIFMKNGKFDLLSEVEGQGQRSRGQSKVHDQMFLMIKDQGHHM